MSHEPLTFVSSWCVNLIGVFLLDVLQQQKNLGRRFSTSKMHLSPPWLRLLVCSKAVILLLLSFCLLLLPLWESVIVLCFVVSYLMSILVLQSSWWGKESWLLCLICLPGVWWWLSGSSWRCHRVVCSLWCWHFLIILSYYFNMCGSKTFCPRGSKFDFLF